ncbi:hypothetical protein BDV97DRAFT_45609 [Delphinella strobiligena]|nr:hypothetical protein BDV97DRAFT_45609 [Delphinella strobiligena]
MSNYRMRQCGRKALVLQHPCSLIYMYSIGGQNLSLIPLLRFSSFPSLLSSNFSSLLFLHCSLLTPLLLLPCVITRHLTTG